VPANTPVGEVSMRSQTFIAVRQVCTSRRCLG
jgi:hypothetical protein